MANLRRKISRWIFLILLIILGLYHLLPHYYKSNPRLLQFSLPGLEAFIYYELGLYRKASHAWRIHYGLSYNLQLIETTKKSLIDQMEENPSKLENYLWLADLYFFVEDYPNARLTYQKALQRNKNSYDAKVGLAASLMMEEKYQESHDIFEDFLNQGYNEKNITSFLNFLVSLDKLENPNTLDKRDSYLSLIYAYRYLAILDDRKLKKVISLFDNAISANKHMDLAFSSKGVVYAKEKKYDLALEQFSDAVKKNPLNAEAYKRMAYIYGEMGNLERELQYYKKAVEVEENNPSYAFHLGEILMRKYGDFKQANFYLQKAYQLNSQNYHYASNYAHCLKMLSRFDEALEVYDNIIKTSPKDPDGYVLKGHCLLKMKKYEEAIQSYSKAQAIRPLDFLAARNLALAYSELKDFEKAIMHNEYALRIRPQDVDTLYFLQYLYRRQGRFEEAYNAVKEILKIQPNHAGAQRVLPYLESNIQRRPSS
ncbi:MAG: tetratricopeptide repeat protein [Deltaproteobacteria bacterium]|nr:tetratricopeptide repeat protein [Deltaproteobacteria bacterium]